MENAVVRGGKREGRTTEADKEGTVREVQRGSRIVQKWSTRRRKIQEGRSSPEPQRCREDQAR